MPMEGAVCAAVSGFCFGSFWIFWGQGPGSSLNICVLDEVIKFTRKREATIYVLIQNCELRIL